jgi:hypothetical protein
VPVVAESIRAMPKVQDLHGAVAAHHDVRGFDVAMDESRAMRRKQARAYPFHPFDLVGERRPALPHDVAQRPAVHVLHRDERLAGMFSDVVEDDDVGVLQLPDRPGFPQEALTVGRVVHPGAHELDGDVAADDRVARQIYRAHAASAEDADDVISTDGRRRFW